MNGKAITAAVEEQEWLSPVAEKMQGAVRDAYAAGGAAGKTVEDALHGVWLGHPLHAVMVAVPLGAWTTAAVLDALELGGRKDLAAGADAAVGIGLLGALGSALAGLTDWYALHGKAQRRTGAAHALLNGGATLLYGASWFLRRRGHRAAGRVCAGLGFAAVGAGGFLGGALSYEQKVGVDHADRKSLPPNFVPVLADADLAEGTPTRAEANGVPVVLVRQGEKISALGATCAHFGAPLNEGTVEDGCLVCPWHGSRFRLTDGTVARGPSVYPQPVFDVRVRNGQVEVRASHVPQNME